ncbi:PliI family lysozyme inhibitor of I-type lysozyme [Spartinivicinus ruber]|uniref:PliI family lysozyme inhibitor of I-type lysozyme n=1 Tax=Spartinivicinus ruber TaxID=2683272 RepID=UPI0013D2E2CD|nr:PliI family lysozyme inhibitor of I-type lysozyme [Spartinivicinus ruber]
MKKIIYQVYIITLITTCSVYANTEDSKMTIHSNGQVIVIEEPSFEPHSIGSFSIRLYKPSNPKFPYDNFITGVISDRDGSIVEVQVKDLDKDKNNEIIVITETAGSGSYFSAYAFNVKNKTIKPYLTINEANSKKQAIQKLVKNNY